MVTIPKIYNVYFVASIATVGGMLFGFDISSMSLIIGTSQYIKYFHDPSGTRQGGITAAMAGGSILGAAASGYVSNKLGRRDAIFVACIWWMIGTTLQVACNGIAMLIVGRLINGLCVGVTSSQVPVYLAEISKKEKRGSILCIQQWAIEWGMLIMYFLSYGWSFYTATPTGSFRGAWAMQYIPCVCLMLGIPFLPRSPRWLAKVGREAQAIQTLADIQAGGNQRDPLVLAEWNEICTVLEAERAGASKGWHRFYRNGMWKRTLAGCSAQAWQQLTGANVMTYYIVYVFEMAGLRGNVALYSSGIEYAVFIVGTAVALLIIDRTGRRPLLIYGAICMGICMFVVGGILGSYGTYLPRGLNGNLDVRITVSGAPSYVVIILVMVYSVTLAPIAWVYAAEVWSLETRAVGMGMATLSNWSFNFAIGFLIPPGFKNITWKLFMIFGTLSMAAAIQFFFTFPETGGKTVEEVEPLFLPGAVKPWKTELGHSLLDDKVRQMSVSGGNQVKESDHEQRLEKLDEQEAMTAV
ncbi:hypothetical protein M433DRAFT_140534 [Acidomyces richmondensis BFW]|nr:MAG: hypothetical protein FE78DRAFT_74339 [Acidomyces sp. 'richmondensis']KYG49005.1 hypothetical protein M433DRAFT_140534 [Acidomyces richmondensis BFW]